MSVTPFSTIVGVFSDRAMAERAMEALYTIGISGDNVRFSSPGSSGGFFGDLKSLFTGPTNAGISGNQLVNDLSNLGLSDDDVQYYSNEYNNGHSILAINAQGREQDVLNILHQNGAYNARMRTANPGGAQQSYYPPAEAQNPAHTWSGQPAPEATQEQPFEQRQPDLAPVEQATDTQTSGPATTESDITSETTQPMTPGYQHAATSAEQYVSPSENDTTDQPSAAHVFPPDPAVNYQPSSTSAEDQNAEPSATDQSDIYQNTSTFADAQTAEADEQPSPTNTTTTGYDDTPTSATDEQATSTNTAATEYVDASEADEQTAPTDTVVTEEATEYQTPAAESTISDRADESQAAPAVEEVPTDYTPEYQTPPAESAVSDRADEYSGAPSTEETPSDQGADYQTQPTDAVEAPTAPPATTTSTHEDELQRLQAQLQEVQRQLAEAKEQLQTAQERETHLKTAREREQQLQSARQQLQDLQDELQATLAELRETQARLAQYEEQ